MRRLLIALALLCVSEGAHAQLLIPYGQAYNYDFCLYDYTTPNELESTITFEAADVKVSQAGTEANATNGATVTDNGLCFTLALTSSETDTARGNIIIADDDDVWLPINQPFITFGNPSAGLPWIGIPGIFSGTTAAAANGASNISITTTLDGEAFNNAVAYIPTTCTGGPGARVITATTDNGATVDLTVNSAFDADPDSCPVYILAGNQGVIATNSTTFEAQVDVTSISGSSSAADNAESVFTNAGYAMSNSSIGDVAGDVAGVVVESAPSTDITLQGALSLLLAEAFGECDFDSGMNVWTCNDPSGSEQRFVISFGTDEGDRDATDADLTPD